MAKQNFLGRGERLTSDVTIKGGGGPKVAPYTFEEARRRLVPMLDQAVVDLDRLPADAYPNDQAIVSLTLNPEYIAKSYFPTDLLRDVGIEVVGSRPRRVKPEKRSRDREPVDAMDNGIIRPRLASSTATLERGFVPLGVQPPRRR